MAPILKVSKLRLRQVSRPCRGWRRDSSPSRTLQVKRKSLQERNGTWAKVAVDRAPDFDQIRTTRKAGRRPSPCSPCQAPCEVPDTQHLALIFRTALATGNVIPIL